MEQRNPLGPDAAALNGSDDNPHDYEYVDGKQAHAEGTNTWSLRLTGRVQGVGFRDFARHAAEELMVCGWVRNEPDGSLVVQMQHPETRILELLVERLKKGPAAAGVEEAYLEQLAGQEQCGGFTIRHT